MYMAPDQDLINLLFPGEILRLAPRFNLQPLHLVYDYPTYFRFFGQPNYYAKEEILKGKEQPGIVHFFRYLGQFPWHLDSLHPDTQAFDHYLALSVWSDYQKEKTTQNSFAFRLERMLYRILPHKIFLPIFTACFRFLNWKANANTRKNKDRNF